MFFFAESQSSPIRDVRDSADTTFLMLYSSDNDSDSVSSAKCRAFTLLSSVCWSWWKTLCGWPESPTPRWVKHQIMKLTRRAYSWIYTCC